jgi:uncharacterized membrane protein (Fun14 family)
VYQFGKNTNRCVLLLGIVAYDLPVEDFLFSAGGGFLFGALAGYAIKKVMKIAAIVVGLFVTGFCVSVVQGFKGSLPD